MLTFELGEMTARERSAVLEREGVDIAAAAEIARPIIEDVRSRGDVAVRRYAKRLDGLKGQKMRVSEDELRSARNRIPRILLDALRVSRLRIQSFHKRQEQMQFQYQDECGTFGQRVVPLRRVGVYVPGGSADYASTVLMASVPARIAGVKEIVLCTPGRDGKVPDAILAAADLCGVSEVYAIGGAHGIAAMAYGTATIEKVQKIVGPGGAVVTAAKLLVRNDCDIDFLAGPSEVLVLADAKGDPELIAADMLAQLEHDPQARAVLVTSSRTVVNETRRELDRMLRMAERSEIASKAAAKGAIFIVAEDMDASVRFSNAYAPEHLLIDVAQPMKLLDKIESAGSVFLGSNSSVAFGDYCSGTNHILPTKGVARMRSTLSVYDFLKMIPYQSISSNGVKELAGTVDILARSEGLPAHAEAAMARKRRMKV
jgi:histidinol dehydrogenase